MIDDQRLALGEPWFTLHAMIPKEAEKANADATLVDICPERWQSCRAEEGLSVQMLPIAELDSTLNIHGAAEIQRTKARIIVPYSKGPISAKDFTINFMPISADLHFLSPTAQGRHGE